MPLNKIIIIAMKNGISLDEYFWLLLIRENNELLFNDYNSYINSISSVIPKKLEELGFIEIINENNSFFSFILMEKSLSLFQVNTIDVKNWIEDWVNLFPKGIQSGGHYVRSDIKSCTNKMTQLIKNNEFTKEQIFEATMKYIERKKNENYAYMSCSANFISKNNVSLLASEIFNLNVSVDCGTTSILEKEIE